jgi:uncharacterized OB-fold protein
MPEVPDALSRLFSFAPEMRPFWEGCAEDRLMLTRCGDTGRAFAYPRGVSPFTLSANVEWFEASGWGVVYTLSRIAGGPASHAIAYVTLDEGPTILTGLVDDEARPLAIGDRVKVVFREVEGGYKAPFFAPA